MKLRISKLDTPTTVGEVPVGHAFQNGCGVYLRVDNETSVDNGVVVLVRLGNSDGEGDMTPYVTHWDEEQTFSEYLGKLEVG